MINKWKEQLRKLSGNLTTNQVMPGYLIEKLLEEDLSLKDKLIFSKTDFPEISRECQAIGGLNIIAGLQNIQKDGHLTLFRSIRFPTYKRIFEVVYDKGYAVLNYEQERILELYENKDYIQKREEIKNNPLFSTQPQERVVAGLPLFCLANDALQIHHAFRGEEDSVVMVVIHIPHELLETRKIRLISNPAIDVDYDNGDRDFEIKDFMKKDIKNIIDFRALRARGIDLHEMYSSDLPWQINEAENLGIKQDFFLLDIYKLNDDVRIKELKENTQLLKENSYFLHGFFGDQNVFGRRASGYLPMRCQKISRKE